MVAHRPLKQRTPAEWAIRSVLAVAAAWSGYVTVTQSLAMALQTSAPERAHILAPGNGFITGRWSRALSGPNATTADRAHSNDVAREALLQDPISLDATATLGINAQIGGDTTSARTFFNYAQTLSRRDLQTQVWAIQDAGTRGDISGALKHYDIALRTASRNTNLFPALAFAVTDPAVREILVRTLAARPNWGDSFINYVGNQGRDPIATSSLFLALHRTGIPIPDSATAGVINALIGSDNPDLAWTYYSSMRGGAIRDESRDPNFASNPKSPSRFDWVPTSDNSIAASIQRSGPGNVFTFSAPPSIGGRVLQQFEMLPPGHYILIGQSEGISQPDDTLPYWEVSCRNGHELGRVNLPNSKTANGNFSGRITIPDNCPVQVLALTVRPSSEVAGVSGQIDRVILKRAK